MRVGIVTRGILFLNGEWLVTSHAQAAHRRLSQLIEKAAMERKTTAVVAMLVLGGWAGRAQAATQVQQMTFAGSQAAFEFEASTSIDCGGGVTGVATAIGFVSGADQINSSTGSPPSMSNGAFVEIDFYSNTCTGAFLSFGDGGIANSYTAPDKKLTSAGIAGVGTVQDFNTGNTFAVSLNVSFAGTRSTSQEKSNTHSKVTGTTHGNLSISHNQSASASRQATVTGVVGIDSVTFTSLDVFFVSLSSNSSDTLTVSK
jgi:hypothetical protein